jgi:hypothetical protein
VQKWYFDTRRGWADALSKELQSVSTENSIRRDETARV